VGVGSDTQKQANKGLNRDLWTRRTFNSADLAVWTRPLAGVVRAGLPLERALGSLSDESEVDSQRNLLAGLRSQVNGGASFAQALSQFPGEFSDIFVAVVGAGEQSGNLGLVLEKLATDMEEQQALRSKLVGAALYPAIVTIVAVVIVMFLLAYVVPQVANVFVGSKRSLPTLTVVMLALGTWVKAWWWLMLITACLLGFSVHWARKIPALRLKIDAAWLTLPILGRLSRGFNSARFASTLAMLSGAGVPILKALQAAAETLGNQAMKADALQMVVQVREGAPLATALGQTKRFPALLAMFSRLGEQTGRLPAMLDHAARQQALEVQRRAMQLATIAEPLLIVAMGLVVMLIVLAVLLPIIELNQLVR
jgi:general secretion pathway protein F